MKTCNLHAFALLMLLNNQLFAQTSTNVAISTNYLNRGVTQTTDSASITGGIEYIHGSGFYTGFSTTSLIGDSETNLYIGYQFNQGALEYDVGYNSTSYYRPGLNTAESYIALGWNDIDTKYSFDAANGNRYLEVSYSFELAENQALMLHKGINNSDTGVNYHDYNITLTLNEVSFILSNTNNNSALGMSDHVRYVVSWQRAF